MNDLGDLMSLKSSETPKDDESVGRRPGRPSLTNEQLLDKALEVFLEQGYDRTSVEAITIAAGMAKRTVYQRYGDKKTLFKHALKRAIDDWILPLEDLAQHEAPDLETTLQNLGKTLVSNIMSPAGIRLMRITNSESGRMPEIGAYTYEYGTERTIRYLADLFRRYLDPGGVRDHDWREAAIAFLYLVVCGPPTMTAWGLTLDEPTIEHHTRYGVQLFLHGLLGAVQGDAPAAEADVADAVAVGASTGADDDLRALRAENRRLKSLLVDAMLQVAVLKEKSA
jgi:TetR/AcrR family transcriptional repressor of mexJK operon